MKLKERIIRRVYRRRILRQKAALESAPCQLELDGLLAAAASVVDLGSGPTPIKGATAAVDLFLDPRQRSGVGPEISAESLAGRNIRFVQQSIDTRLPFADGEFAFAYCSHAIEHVAHPGDACDQMMRVASSGLLRCPAAMAEYMLGRDYHNWLVMVRGGVVLFVEKARDEFRIFGQHENCAPRELNPFEALIDWEAIQPSTPGRGQVGRLKRRLQALYYGRTPLIEINLFWRSGFRWLEFRLDGSARMGGRAGTQWQFDVSGARQEYRSTDIG